MEHCQEVAAELHKLAVIAVAGEGVDLGFLVLRLFLSSGVFSICLVVFYFLGFHYCFFFFPFPLPFGLLFFVGYFCVTMGGFDIMGGLPLSLGEFAFCILWF